MLEQPTIADRPGRPGENRERQRRFSDELATFANAVNEERVSLGMLMQFMSHRSISALLLVFALPMMLPVPAPGLSVLFGVPLIVVSAQLVLGRRRAWLPSGLARRSVGRSDFVAFVARVLPTLRQLETIIRPRFSVMAGNWTAMPIGALCLLLAIIITLPVPFGHMLPGAAISLLALGLMERDGLAIGLGLITAGVALGVVAMASQGIAAWLQAYFGQL